MIVSAFDIATATGCCDGAVDGAPRYWSWDLRDAGESRPARLAMLASFLRRYFEKCPCDVVVGEAPMLLASVAHMGSSEETQLFLRGAVGVFECVCYEAGKPVELLDVKDARQSVIGWRTNNRKTSGIETKKRVMADVRLLGDDPQNDNEADAIVLWRYEVARRNPRRAIAATPLFGGPLASAPATPVASPRRRRGG